MRTVQHLIRLKSFQTIKERCLSSKTDHIIPKKDISSPLPLAYDPKFVEAGWYDWWQQTVCGKDKTPTDGRRPFVLCLPPPNVTGTLHLGHALSTTIQDVLVRWHRMKGERTVWVPGMDHAGISTQVVVERKLWLEKQKRRVDMERERFIEEVWDWVDEKGGVILEQMRTLGASLDWDRHCFTMDEKHSQAVTEAFIRLHDDGLIYRSQRLVNWCCHLRSTISDIEVDNVDIDGPTPFTVPGYDKKVTFGHLESFDYPIPLSDKSITVSTTRLETMLGDSAIAVHPNDQRYTHLQNSHAKHPFFDRTIPIICDESARPDFGTGAVKITPGHDFADHSMARRHELPIYTVIDDAGAVVNAPKQFLGLPRFTARDVVRQALKERGLYRGRTDNRMSIPICRRTQDVVEPRLKHQWFLECRQMADKAIEAVKNGDLKITPAMFEKQWFHWLTNVREWCISRQLWWGHRIPAYFAKPKNGSHTGLWVCARSREEAQSQAATLMSLTPHDIDLTQDEDVLDTWFSSGLFPFSVFGWPNQTSDYRDLFPLSLMETGHDILFFWVARMVMLGQHLTSQLPFNEILLHATLRDCHGKKMSKSVGNVIDPMHVIQGISHQELQNNIDKSQMDEREVKRAKKAQQKDFPQGIPQCGTDALRFTLCCHNFKGDAIHFDVVRAKTNRHFCNKIWQAFRFMTQHVRDDFVPTSDLQASTLDSVVDRWILSRLTSLIHTCDDHLRQYNFHVVTRALRQFWHHELCDVYLECLKPTLYAGDTQAALQGQQVLYHCMDVALRLLSPFMPYLTEELYQRLPGRKHSMAESICVAQYPLPSEDSWRDVDIESNMADVLEITTKLLNLRKELGIKTKTHVLLQVPNDESKSIYWPYMKHLTTLSRADHADIQCTPPASTGWVSLTWKPDHLVYLYIKDLIDPERELCRLHQRYALLSSRVDSQKENTGLNMATSTKQDIKKDKYCKEMDNIGDVIASLEQLVRSSQTSDSDRTEEL